MHLGICSFGPMGLSSNVSVFSGGRLLELVWSAGLWSWQFFTKCQCKPPRCKGMWLGQLSTSNAKKTSAKQRAVMWFSEASPKGVFNHCFWSWSSSYSGHGGSCLALPDYELFILTMASRANPQKQPAHSASETFGRWRIGMSCRMRGILGGEGKLWRSPFHI